MLMNSAFLEEINIFRGWGFKDQKWFINSQTNNFSMSFLIAASETRFYWVMANEGTNNSKIFWYFLSNVLKYRTLNIKNSNNDLLIVWDNASIHKTNTIKDFLKRNELHMLTIPTYCPSLNPIETVIQSIKAKLKQKQSIGR